MSKKDKSIEDKEVAVPVFQPFVLPETGLMSLRKFADYIGLEKVKDLIAVLPDGAVIIKMGKLKDSLIDLRELKKCLVTVSSVRQPAPAPYVPPPPPIPVVVAPPTPVAKDEEE